MQDLKEMWQKVLSKVESAVSIVSYELWIEPLELVDFKEKLIVATNSQNAKKQILKIHQKELGDAIKDVFGEETEYELLDPDEKEEYLKQNKTENQPMIEDDDKKFVFNPT